jgi:FtsZ-binding cell division protein ZapB
MLRRQKEDAKKQKLANAALQAELDALRGIDSSEAGSRTRDANGRNTPQPDDPSSSEALRLKLADAQRQLSQFTKLSSDHQSLTTEHTQLKDEHAQLRDAYIQEMEQANDRIDRLQAEVERLVGVNAGMQDGKRLQIEVEELRNENEDLQRKVRILLEAQDYEEGELSEREGGLRRPSDGSHFGSDDEELNEEDLNQYVSYLISSNLTYD